MIENELDKAYKIIFMAEFQHPSHPEDLAIRHQLKNISTNCFSNNKVDNYERLNDLHPFYSYGFQSIFPISAFQNTELVICWILL